MLALAMICAKSGEVIAYRASARIRKAYRAVNEDLDIDLSFGLPCDFRYLLGGKLSCKIDPLGAQLLAGKGCLPACRIGLGAYVQNCLEVEFF